MGLTSSVFGPTNMPTVQPTTRPSKAPKTFKPSKTPSLKPTDKPSAPTFEPANKSPIFEPTYRPSKAPNTSKRPSKVPSLEPTDKPSAPTFEPTSKSPIFEPTYRPSKVPNTSKRPSKVPSLEPTDKPSAPTFEPTSKSPIFEPTYRPSKAPNTSKRPSKVPSLEPTDKPSAPTFEPTMVPTAIPTAIPSAKPTFIPTVAPTNMPTMQPTVQPSIEPTMVPTAIPTAVPTDVPTMQPTNQPTVVLSKQPSEWPSGQPSAFPSSSSTNLEELYSRTPAILIKYNISSAESEYFILNQDLIEQALSPSLNATRRLYDTTDFLTSLCTDLIDKIGDVIKEGIKEAPIAVQRYVNGKFLIASLSIEYVTSDLYKANNNQERVVALANYAAEEVLAEALSAVAGAAVFAVTGTALVSFSSAIIVGVAAGYIYDKYIEPSASEWFAENYNKAVQATSNIILQNDLDLLSVPVIISMAENGILTAYTASKNTLGLLSEEFGKAFDEITSTDCNQYLPNRAFTQDEINYLYSCSSDLFCLPSSIPGGSGISNGITSGT